MRPHRRTITIVASVALVVGAVIATAPTASAERGHASVVAVPLRELVADLPVATEVRDGYDRSKFKHWVDADRDGCNTRAEVLLAEASTPPTAGQKCSISGGAWYSTYDDRYLAGAGGLDIDHMVPLAEAWDSGASAWSPQRREAYANDLEEPRALIAVSAATNRSKADQDPHEWLPPFEPGRCGYIIEWTVVKVRWGLTVDGAELATMIDLAGRCPNVPLVVSPAP